MAKFPSSGVNVPGFLNTCNSPSMTGYQDPVGNPYFMGLTPGKIVTLGPTEVSQFQAPGTTLYDGAYQWVQLDPNATADNAVAGRAAYILLDSGATQGAQPETAYAVPTVTTADIANTLGLNALFCGVFLNPSTFDGQSNTPTPGNWVFIFVGAGRAAISVGATSHDTLGDVVYPDGVHTGLFGTYAAAPTTGVPTGIAVTTPAANTTAIAYFSDFINRIPF